MVRRGADDDSAGELTLIRSFQNGSPIWSKPLTGIDARNAESHIDRTAGAVFIVSVPYDAGPVTGRIRARAGTPVALRTTIDAATPVEVSPLGHLRADDPLAVTTPVNGWGGILVERSANLTGSDIVWRTAGEDRRLASRLPLRDCLDPWPGTATIWCSTPYEPILFAVDTRAPRITRLPSEVPWHWDVKMLGPSVIAATRRGEIQMIDLDTGRAVRLKMPDGDPANVGTLIEGGLATLARRWPALEGTVVVYQNPFE